MAFARVTGRNHADFFDAHAMGAFDLARKNTGANSVRRVLRPSGKMTHCV